MKYPELLILGTMFILLDVAAVSKPGGQATDTTAVSFKTNIMPIIKRSCLPCHAEDNFNPSDLSLDSYDLLMDGGKHGPPVLPGKPAESILLQKLLQDPPFGDRMPLDPKRKKGEPSARKLSPEEIQLIDAWVRQGAKNN